MKHLPRLGAVALVLTLTMAACSEGNRRPIYYPGSARPSVGERDNRGSGNGNSARPDKNKGRRDEVRCNAGRGSGNGNGRCRNGGGNGSGSE
jgi:predicted small lipoprotein YifL